MQTRKAAYSFFNNVMGILMGILTGLVTIVCDCREFSEILMGITGQKLNFVSAFDGSVKIATVLLILTDFPSK